MSSHVDVMKKALTLSCQAAKICAPSEIVYDRDHSAFRIGKFGFQVQYDATRAGAPVWNVQEFYDTPNVRDGGHDVKLRLIGSGNKDDVAAVAKMVVVEIVSREIDHILDSRLS